MKVIKDKIKPDVKTYLFAQLVPGNVYMRLDHQYGNVVGEGPMLMTRIMNGSAAKSLHEGEWLRKLVVLANGYSYTPMHLDKTRFVKVEDCAFNYKEPVT